MIKVNYLDSKLIKIIINSIYCNPPYYPDNTFSFFLKIRISYKI